MLRISFSRADDIRPYRVRVYYNPASSVALREDARSDENNAFMSEDSTKVRRANKGVEKRKI